ncbi:AraC family transcriptional regulator [Maricurvus nonylphenolicus]|uniref:helix-turn-helix transcriptional regulator n=1 Tax=Maricurvus nonylphenolicus TaxID=1008307 RepID=UPI0036F3E44F
MCTEFVGKLFAGLVQQVISDAGQSPKETLLRHGLSELIDLAPDEQINAKVANKAWALIRQYHGAEATVIRIAQTYFRPAMLGSVGMGLQCSISLKDAIQRLVDSSRFFTDTSLFELVESSDSVGLLITPKVSEEFLCVDNINLSVAFFFAFLSHIYPGVLAPQKVTLFGQSVDALHEHETFYRSSVDCDLVQVGIILSRENAELALPTGNPTLASWQDRFTKSAIEKQRSDRGIHAVKQQVRRCLEHGSEPVCQEVASALNLSQRSFQRKLKEQGTSFKLLVSDVRKAMALEYLSQPASSLNDTAFRLGFSDHSSFARAFRRWYGITPTEFQMSME